MRTALLALLLSSLPALAADERPVHAWAVTAGRAPDERGAEALAARYREMGLPAHGDYPKVMRADALGPTVEGPWVLLVGLPTDRAVGERLASHLVRRGMLAAEVDAVQTLNAQDLRILSVDTVRVLGNGAPLFVYDVCMAGPTREECWGTSRPGDDGRLILAYPALDDGTPIHLWPEAGEPWTCPAVAIGPVRNEDPIWLRGPVEESCYERGRRKRR